MIWIGGFLMIRINYNIYNYIYMFAFKNQTRC